MNDLTDVSTEDLRRALDTARYYEDIEVTVAHRDDAVSKHPLSVVEAELVARGRCD